MSDFSINLKKFREAAGLTRIELAARVGTSNTAIGYYETGKREPQIPILIAIATALHCSTDELLGYQVDEFEHYKAMLENELGFTVTTEDSNITLTIPDDNENKHEFEFPNVGEFTDTIKAAMDGFRLHNRHNMRLAILDECREYNTMVFVAEMTRDALGYDATPDEWRKLLASMRERRDARKSTPKITRKPDAIDAALSAPDATTAEDTPPASATTKRAPKKRTTKNPRSKKNED